MEYTIGPFKEYPHGCYPDSAKRDNKNGGLKSDIDQFTEMEKTSVELDVIVRSNMFRCFYNVMWKYADEVLLMNLKNPRLAFGTYIIANDLHKCLESLDLDKEMEPEFDWYKEGEGGYSGRDE
ncbi:hypothetical protein GCK72_022449 [Caenorhabditis remanei]|uniref:Uncharacterized protein n=1 Tax=Caenorhabditis remanei TaxID=31234 RepID=A0A6A5FTS1_CAERE|nr:hypothetical protein GCK72_022449 [Caenorhabditis remanei]KAF1745998.1 hypothetical protein GCK72_022449 [Caenorhabditis remanei]